MVDAPRNHKKATQRIRNDPRHLALRKQRTSVERAFSQLKGKHSLNKVTVRGHMKVVTHVYLGIIALQVG